MIEVVDFQACLESLDQEFRDYVRAVGARHCPYIEPSLSNASMCFSTYRLCAETPSQVHALIYYIGFVHAALTMRQRLHASDKRRRNLACENVVFQIDEKMRSDLPGPMLFMWAHWLLKTDFTSVGLLFGKFWRGEQDVDKDGISIPPPPCDFLSIRSAIPARDTRFFENVPQLIQDYEAATGAHPPSNEEQLINKLPGRVRPFAIRLFRDASRECIVNLIAEMYADQIFEQVFPDTAFRKIHTGV